ncbi:nitroreductase family protein [Ruminiclostridium hungatei]|uniref:Nitroreductase family protein n=1 Tax=Ruminiclostridium hungatei TaxID=48256 RepID=A0A1V4SHI6_RUMHU|nr:nitroreductase family protein [Ruminiclostridium hungatei]OPX43213.1 nitroreductase family protein [Ruminiclostridium hungatei]
MTNSELYKVIFKRKSVRKYDLTPLAQEKLEMLQAFLKTVKRLEEGIRTEFLIQTADEVSSVFAVKAPHYITFYSESKAGYLINAGFIMQQVDLFLSANNIGSCWLGVAKPNKNVPQAKDGLQYVIMLAFGNASGAVHRESTQQFRRKSLAEITSIEGAEQLLEPVRLAPSAGNSQTWFFTGDTREIIVSRKKAGIIKAQLYGKMNHIDSGIALCHLWLSAEQQGKKADIDLTGQKVPQGYEFMAKVRLED